MAASAREGECYQTEGEKCKSGCTKGRGDEANSAARSAFKFVTRQIVLRMNGKMPIPRESNGYLAVARAEQATRTNQRHQADDE
jgi:hypothetical protein